MYKHHHERKVKWGENAMPMQKAKQTIQLMTWRIYLMFNIMRKERFLFITEEISSLSLFFFWVK